GYALKPDKSGIWKDNRKVEDFTNVSRELSVAAKAGVGLLVTPQHLIGLRYEYNYLKSDGEWKDLQDAVFSRKGTAIDLVTPSSRFRASSVSKSDRHDHKLSLSYLGETDGWELSANIDYTSGIQTGRDTDTESPEGNEELTSDSQSEFIAVDGFSRFNASHPLWKGDILFGLSLDNYVQNTNSEDNCTKDSRIHNNVLCLIPGAYVSLKQDFGPVKVDLGLQYRYYCSIYTPFDDDSTRGRITELMGQPRLSCLDWMLHPHLSVSVPVGKGAVSAGAQVLTDYPPFSSLSIMIDELKKNDASKAFAYPARRDEIYLKGEWERFQVKGWATRNQMPLFTDVDGGGDFNGPSYWSMDWKMTFSNAVGFWGTDITATLHKQWLDMETLKSDDNLSAPLVTVNWINSFSLPWGMKIDLSSLLRTGGAERNVYCRGVFFKADLSLRQSFLKDRLTLSLGADNLIRTTQDLSFHTKASDMEFVSSKRLEGRIFRLSVKFTL
ncbi:MAG: outer membrane beta-barrel family protein, partial [Bacteroidales bacterium]|nr:outer membrane beta-barrel family protein [Bacteroidales bacterium]